jgi:hypothetical protein
MQVTIDTRHDTLEEALAVIQMAFARTKDLAAAQATAEATGPPIRRRTASRARGGRGARGTASAGNDAVAAPATHAGSASQADADTGIPAAAVDDDASGRAPATARKAPTKTAVAKKAATEKTPTKKGSAKKAVAARSATKRAPASTSAGSGNGVASNIAPPGRADVVRAWARDQGMQVKAAGRMPVAVIAAYDQAHS